MIQISVKCPYDIGDIYITTNTVHPNDKWKGTSWKQIIDSTLLGGVNL